MVLDVCRWCCERTSRVTIPVTAIREVVARRFTAPFRRFKDCYWPLLPKQTNMKPVTGCLVGVSDGECWGWWGSVSSEIALAAQKIFAAIQDRTPATPIQWARRARFSTRHSHTGLLAIAVGAFELACWDLVGKRRGLPVWALVGKPQNSAVATYATCFGINADNRDAMLMAESIAALWKVQKWRPVPDADLLNALGSAAGGDGRLALDFGGTWSFTAVAELCNSLRAKLAWIEEPYAPSEIHHAFVGLMPAPHAAGEHCYGPAETAILEAAGVEIWQPDAVFCGGFGAIREIARRAKISGRRCIPHGGGFIPAIHAAIAGTDIECVEYHLLLEPSRQAHLEQPILAQSTMIAQPACAGWAGPLHPELRLEPL